MASSCVEYNLTNVDLMEKGIVVIAGKITLTLLKAILHFYRIRQIVKKFKHELSLISPWKEKNKYENTELCSPAYSNLLWAKSLFF